ncbi:Baseplate hub assembly protein, bacteriophage T4-like [uncultured Caudovirales phage]|uniref:Baseplate hub assembly protein, bacteriophage T4-like n=1 Tax=uncultured Caudovirales phage TaxID=2100421 RepID=A0A6J5L6X6_9CAUD|nr:Baseplate hub assembly protein, bacteriophage T4-like [uncultured Caudovirales phage]
MNQNPLFRHFRQPAIYFKLPSNGCFWPDGSLVMPPNNELPVLPMTARDEIVLRTPDALLNGAGIVDVIQSCCPNIKNAWDMPSIDVDATLIAIRIASYGQTMEIETQCPTCRETNEFGVALSPILESIQSPNYKKKLTVNGLDIMFKPQPYFAANKINMLKFQEDQVMKIISDSSLSDEERKKQFDEQLKRLTDLNIERIAASTASITTEMGEIVTSQEFIREFYSNSSSDVIKQVRTAILELAKEAELKPHDTACPACSAAYKVSMEFNQTNFFGTGS